MSKPILTALVFAAAVGASGPGLAAAPDVTVVIGDELADKADDYGRDEVDDLARELDEAVEQALAEAGTFQDARVVVTLVDAVPNRPTAEQLRGNPGLSLISFGIGGADISAEITSADGQTQTVTYRWYESDIRAAEGRGTWTDAERTFRRFARGLAEGSL